LESEQEFIFRWFICTDDLHAWVIDLQDITDYADGPHVSVKTDFIKCYHFRCWKLSSAEHHLENYSFDLVWQLGTSKIVTCSFWLGS
jgi:hypothetical protein